MTAIEFDAFDYRADRTFAKARYVFRGDTAIGWRIERDGATVLELGPGYRPLRVLQCGVCSTDLSRHMLPCPLPQVIGHEVVAADATGRSYVVEINASHAALGVECDCAFCRAGLATHCPDRRTLGIHDLPGGFGPWILAPVGACLAVPPGVPDDVAVLVEPFAAALNAVTTVAPRAGESVAVLGARRLGMLVVAALAAVRDRAPAGARFAVAAVVRDPQLAALARDFGADAVHVLADRRDDRADGGLAAAFDIVVDTTGSPAGLERAVALARREVHLKSTHGRPAGGLAHPTELVVDELAIARFDGAVLQAAPRQRVAWLAAPAPPAALCAAHDVRVGAAGVLAAQFGREPTGLRRADCAVVDSAAGVDAAIRPLAGREQPLVRPRGEILLVPSGAAGASPLLHAIAARGLRLSSSRCGDFRAALDLLAASPALRRTAARLVTHRFDAADLPRAFATARTPACVKAVVVHGGGSVG